MKVSVGIFWAVSGEVFCYAEERETGDIRARERASRKIDSDLEHFKVWDAELAGRFPHADFATFPRGRVMFDFQENRHIIYADECVTGEEMRRVAERFGAIGHAICRDDHYRCDRCMREKLPQLYVAEYDDCYALTLAACGDTVKRTLPKDGGDIAACGLEDIAFLLDAPKPYCKFLVDRLPSAAFSVFFAEHTGILSRYVIRNKIFYKILDGEDKIGANLISLSCNGRAYLIECGTELEPTEAGTKLREKIVKTHYTACFITHYHRDHAGLLTEAVNCDRIYMGEAAFRILKAIGGISEENARKVVPYSGEKIELDGMTVTPYLCDHSAYDSYMLYFKSEKNSLFYTGDFRSHGRKSYSALLGRLPRKVGTLICEGTNDKADAPMMSERDVENALAALCACDAPVFVLQSATNFDRIVSVYRAAIRSGRILILRLVQADLCAQLKNIPQPNGFKRCFAYSEFPMNEEQYEHYIRKYGRRLIGREGISKIKKYVMEVTSNDLPYLQKLAETCCLKGAKLVYSTWKGYQTREDMRNFLDGVRGLGMEVVDLHASGHADKNAIAALKKRLDPDEWIQVHKPRES